MLKWNMLLHGFMIMSSLCVGGCNQCQDHTVRSTVVVSSGLWGVGSTGVPSPVWLLPENIGLSFMSEKLPELSKVNKSRSAQEVFEQSSGKKIVWIPQWSEVKECDGTYEGFIKRMKETLEKESTLTYGSYLKDRVAYASEMGPASGARPWWFYVAMISDDHVLMVYMPSDSNGRKMFSPTGQDPLESTELMYRPYGKK